LEQKKIDLVKKEREVANKFTNFVNYMELRSLAGEDNEEYLGGRGGNEDDDEEDDEDNGGKQKDLSHIIGKKQIKKQNKKNLSNKEKEKARRMKGQSSIATWKPDAFMKLRQEFD
jgi:hypothetical protein